MHTENRSLWSATNVAARVVAVRYPAGKFALVDSAGAFVDWPMLDSREEAEADLASMKREHAGAERDAASEAHGMRCMGQSLPDNYYALYGDDYGQ